MTAATFDVIAWRKRLAFSIGLHDTIVAGDRMLGGVSAGHEHARLAVVALLDEATAAGYGDDWLDRELAALA